MVIGTAQDGGYPHTGCSSECCIDAWKNSSLRCFVSSIVILKGKDCYFFDITPDFKYQYKMIEDYLGHRPNIKGIFITHAHTGHYSGLLELGLESMNTDSLPLYVMPRMKLFIEKNAPFTQLIELQNINIINLKENLPIDIDNKIKVIPFQVPHRNEFSETVGFTIQTKSKSVLYIPDIDSWDKWKINIIDLIKKHTLAFLDGTFYDKKELKNRNIIDIPHPAIKESMNKFSPLGIMDRKKVNFIHLNHTNNAIREDSPERKKIENEGYNIALDGMVYSI
jgi:pyrroloquinoline quinone biosynthesis protein B